jgi:hypothetical protein
VKSLLVLCALTAIGRADTLADARAAYDNLEQQRVVEMLPPPTIAKLGDRERASALRLLGCAHMVLGDRIAAIASFRESFALEPDAALEPGIASPDARSLFEVARGEWRAALVAEMEGHALELSKLQLTVHAPDRGRGGEPLEISVGLVDATQLVSRIELSFRRRGHSELSQMTMRPHAQVTFTIAPQLTSSPTPFAFEYYVTLRHQSGFDLRRYGDADHPHVIEIAAGHPPQPLRWYDSWWVRGAIAVGVVGVGFGGYVAYRSIDVGAQNVVIGR